MKDLIKRLRTYNAWRRGADITMPDPKEIGVDIDSAIAYLEEMQRDSVAIVKQSLIDE